MRPAGLALLCCAVALGGCARERERVLGIVTPPDARSTQLGWYARDTLAPVGRGVDLGEFHDAWAFAPGGRTLAVGTLGRTGVRLVDVAPLRIARDVPLPVAAEGVG